MIREREAERAVRAAVVRATVRTELSARDLATTTVPARQIERWRTGEKAPRVWELRELLPRAIERDPAGALRFLGEALGLHELGLVISQMPRVRGAGDVLTEVASTAVKVGRLQEWALDHGPLEEGELRARELARSVAQAHLAIRTAASGQQVLAMVGA